MRLPSPRGPISDFLIEEMAAALHDVGEGPIPAGDPLSDDDLHLSLYLCYELHYKGLDDVDARWEWEPSLLRYRRSLEYKFEEALRERVGHRPTEAAEVPTALLEIASRDGDPSLSKYIESRATQEQAREFMIHRSIYHLREADPHTWAIPRLSGKPKAALIEIQMDEYGSGIEERMHSSLFSSSLEAFGLNSRYGVHADLVPGITLATVNLMSLFGLHRRLRGACVGHLALFEMTSSVPNRRYANGLRRLGFGSRATAFFDEHVEADSVHEVIAAHDLAGTLANESEELASDILFGAEALSLLDEAFAEHVIDSWEEGRTSLREQRAPTATG
jgi:hypothetical protein